MKGNRDKALAALLACSSVRAASEYSGISESTLWRYLKEPEFCTILDQRRAETMQRAAAALNEQLESAHRQFKQSCRIIQRRRKRA